ncbi:hypothetical protein CEXT_493511 [Caerostris extrusa]|uniref:Uncharacterized protein n=1 Tax=Caerostris extrusa TaxID=172846 RepID=A0AAV4N1I0_CAEEX|nr:hypothetical protein CEXT_493511 [Caerostris extrusa]
MQRRSVQRCGKEAQELLVALRDQVDRQPFMLPLLCCKDFPNSCFEKDCKLKRKTSGTRKDYRLEIGQVFAAQLFTEVFSIDILTPLEDSDTQYRLEIAIAEGSKSASIIMYEYEDSPADGQSVATTVDDYRAVTSDLETVASEEPFQSLQFEPQQLSTGDSIAVNLASTEDVTLEPEDQKVTYSHSSYSTPPCKRALCLKFRQFFCLYVNKILLTAMSKRRSCYRN